MQNNLEATPNNTGTINPEVPEGAKRGKKGKIRTILIRDEKVVPTTDPLLKKYKTFTNSSKQIILSDIKRRVMPASEHEFNQKKDSKDLLRALAKMDLNDYNNLLTEVLTQHLGSFNPSTKNLTLWRRKMKNWLQNISKPEKRGGVLVSEDKFEKFRIKLVEILTSMPYRVFGTLRERILVVLEEVYNQEQEELGRKCYKPFNRNTCSKHWWFNFQRRYPEIKKLWERLPLERSLNKNPRPDDSPNESNSINEPLFKKFISDTKIESELVKRETEPLTVKSNFMPNLNFDPSVLTSLIVNQLNFKDLMSKNANYQGSDASTNIKSEVEIKAEVIADIPPITNTIQPVKVIQPIQKSFDAFPKITSSVPTKVPYIHSLEPEEFDTPIPMTQPSKSIEEEISKSATEKAKEHFSPEMLAKINEIVMQALLAHKDNLLGSQAPQKETEIIQSVVQSVVPSNTRSKIVEERVVTTETKTVYRTIYEPAGDVVKTEEH